MSVDYEAWRKSARKRPVLLALIEATDALGAPVVLCFASARYQTGAADTPANRIFRARLDDVDYEASMPEAFGGASRISWGSASIRNSDGKLDALKGYAWGGAIDLYLGDETWSLADLIPVLSDGRVTKVRPSDDALKVTIEGKESNLNRRAQVRQVTSGTSKHQFLPVVFGYCRNVALVQLAANVYGCIGPIQAFSKVYANDVEQTSGVTTNLNDNGIAKVTFSATPSGRVTADIQGLTVGGVYKDRLGGAAQAIMTRTEPVLQGQAQAGGTNTITLSLDASDQDDAYNGASITLTHANDTTETRTITDYTGITRVATVSSNWTAAPVEDDYYEIITTYQAGAFTASDLDTSAWTGLDTTYPYTAGVVAGSGGENTLALLDRLLAGARVWYNVRRATGLVTCARLEVPSGTPAMALTDRRTFGNFAPEPQPIYWQVVVKYQRNHAPNATPDSAVPEARREWLRREWRQVIVQDAQIKRDYPEATAVTVETCFDDETAAKALGDHILALHGVPRDIVEVETFLHPFFVDLGDVVQIDDTRYGYDTPRLMRIIGLRDRFSESDTMRLWG